MQSTARLMKVSSRWALPSRSLQSEQRQEVVKEGQIICICKSV